MVLKGLLTGQGIKSNAMILNAHVWGYDNLTKATLLVASLSSGTVCIWDPVGNSTPSQWSGNSCVTNNWHKN